jgi:hypothetical protein
VATYFIDATSSSSVICSISPPYSFFHSFPHSLSFSYSLACSQINVGIIAQSPSSSSSSSSSSMRRRETEGAVGGEGIHNHTISSRPDCLCTDVSSSVACNSTHSNRDYSPFHCRIMQDLGVGSTDISPVTSEEGGSLEGSRE